MLSTTRFTQVSRASTAQCLPTPAYVWTPPLCPPTRQNLVVASFYAPGKYSAISGKNKPSPTGNSKIKTNNKTYNDTKRKKIFFLR